MTYQTFASISSVPILGAIFLLAALADPYLALLLVVVWAMMRKPR